MGAGSVSILEAAPGKRRESGRFGRWSGMPTASVVSRGTRVAIASTPSRVIRLRIENGRHIVQWAGLVLPPRCDARERVPRQRQALENRMHHLRCGTGEGARWYAVHPEHPQRRAWRRTKAGVVGLDRRVSTFAGASGADPASEPSCPKIQEPAQAIGHLYRGIDRSRRATTAAAFASDGTTRKGAKLKNGSRSRRGNGAAPARAVESFQQPLLEPPGLSHGEDQGLSHKGSDAHA